MRLGVFISHPIQYFSPLWRVLAASPGLDPIVHYFSDHSVRGGLDEGFGVNVAWDVPLLEGYEHRFIRRDADLARPATVVLPDARGLLTDGKFDAVLVQSYVYGFERQVIAAARRLRLRTLARGEFTDVTPYGGRSRLKAIARGLFLRRWYRQIDAFCCIGNEARKHLERHGVPARRIFFSPYSVDTHLLEAQRARFDRYQCRAELGIEPDQTALLFSGKMIPRKAPLTLLQAVSQLGEERNKLALIMVGDGEQRSQVETAGRQLLGPRLLLPGFVNQSQIGKYFAAADVFVLPSEFETWGLVVNEALQFGLSAIVSDAVGCHSDLITQGETGFTFPSTDAAALAERIRWCVQHPDALREMGPKARARIANYSVEASADGVRHALGLT